MIRIASSLLDAIADRAAGAYPEECCGLLIGTIDPQGDVRVARLVASANVAEGDRRAAFEIDPQVHFDVIRALRDAPGERSGEPPGERIVGHYHSHPDHPALPSARDLERAWEPGLIWLIAAVPAGRPGEIRAHAVNPASGRFREIPLRPESP